MIGAALGASTRAEVNQAKRPPAKRTAFGIGTARCTQVAAAQGIARLAFRIAARIRIADQVALRLGTFRLADAACGARIAAAIRIAQQVLRTNALVRAMIRAGVCSTKQVTFGYGARARLVAKRIGGA